MIIGDTVKMTQEQLSYYPPVIAAHLREIRWRVLDKDGGGAIKIRQIGGSGLVSWVKASEFERADA